MSQEDVEVGKALKNLLRLGYTDYNLNKKAICIINKAFPPGSLYGDNQNFLVEVFCLIDGSNRSRLNR